MLTTDIREEDKHGGYNLFVNFIAHKFRPCMIYDNSNYTILVSKYIVVICTQSKSTRSIFKSPQEKF